MSGIPQQNKPKVIVGEPLTEEDKAFMNSILVAAKKFVELVQSGKIKLVKSRIDEQGNLFLSMQNSHGEPGFYLITADGDIDYIFGPDPDRTKAVHGISFKNLQHLLNSLNFNITTYDT